MLFHSYEFLFLFFPVTYYVYRLLAGRLQIHVVTTWLALASLFFYGWWNPVYLWLILFSISVNYTVGYALVALHRQGRDRRSRILLIVGIGINLCLLAYFKYADFIINNVNLTFGSRIAAADIVLPLAISFFTFQQIAYLVDAFKGYADEHNFLQYALFVSFFPQLIAGPIVHHKEMMPQFSDPETYRFRMRFILVGVTLFAIGFIKKVVFADGLAGYTDAVFDNTALGATTTLFDAWGGALAFTLQLYFDFSGYTDMAIGLALFFGIRLPMNFFSPYRAVNIIEFWRRWHMTLSRFLKDYLYIPLGGNRKGTWRRYLNVMITMALGGLWHGANWTFVLWGSLHGVYLVINRIWCGWRKSRLPEHHAASVWGRFFSYALTFTAVVVGWVFFRAPDVHSALSLVAGMSGLHGVVLPVNFAGGMAAAGDPSLILPISAYSYIVPLLAVVWFLPNSEQVYSWLQGRIDEIEQRWHRFSQRRRGQVARHPVFRDLISFLGRNSYLWLTPIFLIVVAFGALVIAHTGKAVAPFIYFQF